MQSRDELSLRLLECCLGIYFPLLLRNSGIKQNNLYFVSAEALRHWSAHIIIYIHSPSLALFVYANKTSKREST